MLRSAGITLLLAALALFTFGLLKVRSPMRYAIARVQLTGPPQAVEAAVAHIRSPTLLQEAIVGLTFSARTNKRFRLGSSRDADETAARLWSRDIEATRLAGSPLVEIRVGAPNANDAYMLLTNLVQKYSRSLSTKAARATNGVEFQILDLTRPVR